MPSWLSTLAERVLVAPDRALLSVPPLVEGAIWVSTQQEELYMPSTDYVGFGDIPWLGRGGFMTF